MIDLNGRRGEGGEFVVTRSVYETIHREIGTRAAERGGLLGGARADGIVTSFHYDATARRSAASYSPDTDVINGLLEDDWNPSGIDLLGFVHSHPRGIAGPSSGDLEYARRILAHNRHMAELLLPIVMTEPDTGAFELHAYAAVREDGDVTIERRTVRILADAAVAAPVVEVEVLEDSTAAAATAAELLEDMAAAAPAPGSGDALAVNFGPASVEHPMGETFARVETAYDLGRLAASRVVCVGAGGAASFVEDLARAGVGEFVLVDPDVIGESNLATQHVRRRDLGRPKVEALAEWITDINPNAVVVARAQSLDDLDDATVATLATGPLRTWRAEAGGAWGMPGLSVPVEVSIPPAATLLCGLTDSFEAQARVNRLALNLGVPSLCAQVYREGRGAEITVTVPGVTPACHRCALRGRYEAYLENGYRNDVTSNGTPIVATTRLNALKGFLALAILQRGGGHPRWSGMVERIGTRSLVQVRMDPDVPLAVFDRVFGGGDTGRILFDETVWLPQEADCPANGFPFCPDCGGTGDLRNAVGSFQDTRETR